MGKKLRSEGLSKEEMTAFYEKHSAAVYRVCMSYVKDPHDAADLMQETFLKWVDSGKRFENEAHEIGWLVIKAGSLCKSFLKKRKRHQSEDISEAYDIGAEDNSQRNREVLEAVMALPDKYKTVVYLFYYEDMTTEQIAKLTGAKSSAVRSQLTRARKILRRTLGDDDNG